MTPPRKPARRLVCAHCERPIRVGAESYCDRPPPRHFACEYAAELARLWPTWNPA